MDHHHHQWTIVSSVRRLVWHLSPAVRRFALANVFSLYYHQEWADRFRIYYDRDRFRRLYERLEQHYCLYQYRKLLSHNREDEVRLRSLGYPLHIGDRFRYLRAMLALFVAYIVRCFAIVFVPTCTSTREWRVWMGTECFGTASRELETCFLIWSSISALSIRFAFTDHLLDYKFMAVFRMTTTNRNYHTPADFGLSRAEFEKFASFRVMAFLYLLAVMVTISTFGPICYILLGVRVALFTTHTLLQLFWTVTLSWWILCASHMMYSNMVAFIILARYMQIKQKSICDSLHKCLTMMMLHRRRSSLWQRFGLTQWQQFLRLNVRYAHFQDELQDYNHFWRTYLSIVFVFFVFLVCFLIYIVFLSHTEPYIKTIFVILLCVHVWLLAVIIGLSGNVSLRNTVLYKQFTSLLAHFVDSYPHLRTMQNVKMSNLAGYVKDTPSAFSLMNGYPLTYETFQMLVLNVASFFILIVKG